MLDQVVNALYDRSIWQLFRHAIALVCPGSVYSKRVRETPFTRIWRSLGYSSSQLLDSQPGRILILIHLFTFHCGLSGWFIWELWVSPSVSSSMLFTLFCTCFTLFLSLRRKWRSYILRRYRFLHRRAGHIRRGRDRDVNSHLLDAHLRHLLLRTGSGAFSWPVWLAGSSGLVVALPRWGDSSEIHRSGHLLWRLWLMRRCLARFGLQAVTFFILRHNHGIYCLLVLFAKNVFSAKIALSFLLLLSDLAWFFLMVWMVACFFVFWCSLGSLILFILRYL